jgi:hypothetical protein
MVEDFNKIKKENKQLKAKDKKKVNWENKKVVSKSILKTNRPTLTIQKPRDNPYINRFFNEEWAND